ncbi:MAG: hypothetical protein JXR69_09205 [Candidatus Delongbacteria bacterium]|nr:hypothetical protein [Candidatus Delongbacteria bacterium]
MKVLLSIKPKYADKIFDGTKKYERPLDISSDFNKIPPQSFVHIQN